MLATTATAAGRSHITDSERPREDALKFLATVMQIYAGEIR